MSDSVALVAVGRVVKQVRNHVSVSQALIGRVASSRGITVEQAKDRIITSAAKLALKLTDNDERAASTALIIVRGKQNRLAQCAKLLRKHPESVVSAAYEIKEELAVATAPLRFLCELVEHTDADADGEASRIQGLLDEIAMKAVSKEQEWYFHHRIRNGVQSGRFIEAIIDEILQELEDQSDEGEKISHAQSEAYKGRQP